MANTYFQFKKFKIHQECCAMKVCTDSCIQGALAALELPKLQPKTGLDIGTGTGLLSLMLLQDYNFKKWSAIEINEDAAQQAQENFNAATFGTNIRCTHKDFRNFKTKEKFDFIICNPPFYQNDLKTSSAAKNQALHSSHLSYEELLIKSIELLENEGVLCLMVPYLKEELLCGLARKNRLFPYRIMRIKHRSDLPYFRSVLFLSFKKKVTKKGILVIKTPTQEYTDDFKTLLSPYYLHL